MFIDDEAIINIYLPLTSWLVASAGRMSAITTTHLISGWRWWRKGIRWEILTSTLDSSQLAFAPEENAAMNENSEDEYTEMALQVFSHLSLEHGRGGGAALVLQPERHWRGHRVLEVADLTQIIVHVHIKYFWIETYWKKCMNEVSLYAGQGFSFDDNGVGFVFFCGHQTSEPGPFCQFWRGFRSLMDVDHVWAIGHVLY